MTTIASLSTRPCLTSAWRLAPAELKFVIVAGAERIVSATRRLEARWHATTGEAIALDQQHSLSDCELRDIGIGRSEVPRIAGWANAYL